MLTARRGCGRAQGRCHAPAVLPFPSLMIASGANVKTVQAQLGHKTATMTLGQYGHLFPDDLDDVAAVCRSSWTVTRGNLSSAAWQRLTAAPNQCVVVGGRIGCPSVRLPQQLIGDLPTITGAKSLSTDADTATERAACVFVVGQ
jgi:hypothetical protein